MHFDPDFRDDDFTPALWRQALIELSLPQPGMYGNLRVMRQAARQLPLFGRQLAFPHAVEWTTIYEGDTLWMSDTPQERLMMLQATAGMNGHILIAGGGLAIYPQYLRHYGRAERITIVERHPDVVGMLRATLGPDQAIEIVHMPFEHFIMTYAGLSFDGCFIDIHPTLDPRWLPRLNWLRDRCATCVAGTLRIWGYRWMVNALVRGLLHEYIPLLHKGLCFDDELGRGLTTSLPAGWKSWTTHRLRAWLVLYAHEVSSEPIEEVPPVELVQIER